MPFAFDNCPIKYGSLFTYGGYLKSLKESEASSENGTGGERDYKGIALA